MATASDNPAFSALLREGSVLLQCDDGSICASSEILSMISPMLHDVIAVTMVDGLWIAQCLHCHIT